MLCEKYLKDSLAAPEETLISQLVLKQRETNLSKTKVNNLVSNSKGKLKLRKLSNLPSREVLLKKKTTLHRTTTSSKVMKSPQLIKEDKTISFNQTSRRLNCLEASRGSLKKPRTFTGGLYLSASSFLARKLNLTRKIFCLVCCWVALTRKMVWF